MKLIIDITEEDYKDIKNEIGFNVSRLVEYIKNGIPLDEIRDEIDRLHYHPKLDFIKNDEVVDMILDIIDKNRG